MNSYNTNYYIRICTYQRLADTPKKLRSFEKRTSTLSPRYVGMCTFSTKTLRHWRMRFETPAHTISFLYHDTIQDSRLIRIHFHAIANPLVWIRTNLRSADTTKKTFEFQEKGFPLDPRYSGMCTFRTKKIETLTHAIWDMSLYDFFFVPEPFRIPSKIQDLCKSISMPPTPFSKGIFWREYWMPIGWGRSAQILHIFVRIVGIKKSHNTKHTSYLSC